MGHEQHMHFLKLILGVVPFQLWVSRPGKDEAVEDHTWVIQAMLKILDPFMEPNLLAGGAFVQQAVRLDEGDILHPVFWMANKHPQNKIRMEVTDLEESHTFAAPQVSEQKELHSILIQVGFMLAAPGFQVDDELIIAFVEGDRKGGSNLPFKTARLLSSIRKAKPTKSAIVHLTGRVFCSSFCSMFFPKDIEEPGILGFSTATPKNYCIGSN